MGTWLFGGTKGREIRETRSAWEEVEALWRTSPLFREGLSPQVVVILRELRETADRCPSKPVMLALGAAIQELLCSEPVQGIIPYWDLIEDDPEIAIEFRKALALRRRWSAEYPGMFGSFKRVMIERLVALMQMLPEACFDDSDCGTTDVFEVPLIELVGSPAALIEGLCVLPYDDGAMRRGLFEDVRLCHLRNTLVASGFDPSVNPALVQKKLILPTVQKGKSGAELADAYLRGSPFRAFVDTTIPFHIPEEARFEHCHIVGGTGHGKTQLLQKMIHADLEKAREDGRSVVVIDSQGDLINKLVRLDLFAPDAPQSLCDRLILIDPADIEYPAALNLFDARLDRIREYSPADRERVLNGVVELYELFFGAFLGAELTQKQGVIFRYLARLMLAVPDATIYTLIKIMEDGKPYQQFMDQLDGAARHFFETEFFHPSFAQTKKQVIRRLWGVLSTPAFERMLTQPKNKIDLFAAMNEGKIILVSTAKDLLKRDGSQLLGRFFIAMIMQAAQERSTLKDYERTPTFVYVDEAQEYFDDSIETILTQARKYRVGLTIAHQSLDQGPTTLRSALSANTSIKCVGGVSAKDARAVAAELHTTQEFIEGMKRRGDRTEFALWVKQKTDTAIRLSVPLGFLERQLTLDEDGFDELIARNRLAYCGTLASVRAFALPSPAPQLPAPVIPTAPVPAVEAERRPAEPPSVQPVKSEAPESQPTAPMRPQSADEPMPGKGGKNHRYLQSLVKQLAEQEGLHAALEASLPDGPGQVDVLIERDGVLAAIEISVSTPSDYEALNLRKCLASGYPRVGVLLAKSKRTRKSFETSLSAGLSETERARVTFLAPEDLPDFIAALAPPAQPTEKIVKGYRVRTSHTPGTLEDAKVRREALARVIARSMEKP